MPHVCRQFHATITRDLGHQHAPLYRVRDPDTHPSPEVNVRTQGESYLLAMVSGLQAPALMVCVLRHFALAGFERVYLFPRPDEMLHVEPHMQKAIGEIARYRRVVRCTRQTGG